jgi:hypothetical protein
MVESEKISIYDYLDEAQWLFATWGIFGAFSLYLLDFLGRFSDTNTQLATTVNNVTARTPLDISNYITSGIAVQVFQIAVTASFVIFLLISISLSQKCVDYIGRGFKKSVQEQKFFYEPTVLLVFLICLLFLLAAIAIFVIVKFLNTLVIIEGYFVFALFFFILLFALVVWINQRNDKKKIDDVIAGLRKNKLK